MLILKMFLFAVMCVVGTSRVSAATATVYDFGAVGDGAADDTAALQKAVDAGTGDVRLPRGVYRITKPIVVDLDKVGFTSVSGSGTARIVMAGPGPALKFVGTHVGTADPKTLKPNVWQRQRMPMVDGIEIVGAHEKAVGIEAVGAMQLTVTRVLVRDALHGIHLRKRNRNVIVSNCHLYKNRGVGIYLDAVNLHQINVSCCHISYNGGGGIVVRDSGLCNLQISGCDIEANMSPGGPPTANVWINTAGGSRASAEITIVGCTIQHTHAAPNSANIRFTGTDLKDRREADRVWGNVTIADNVLSDAQFNVDLRNTRGVSIVGNTFWRGFQYNLRVEESSNIVIGPNIFDRNPKYYWGGKRERNALLIRNCTDCTLTGLHINGTLATDAGLVIENCRRLNVTNCTILDCENAGMLLKNVTHCRVSDCLIRNDLPDAEGWISLQTVGGCGNMIVNNLLGGPLQVDPEAARLSGNVIQP